MARREVKKVAGGRKEYALKTLSPGQYHESGKSVCEAATVLKYNFQGVEELWRQMLFNFRQQGNSSTLGTTWK